MTETDLDRSELVLARRIILMDVPFLFKCHLLRDNVLLHMNIELNRLGYGRMYNIGAIRMNDKENKT